MSKIRYIAVHPLNDFSGSPRVLADFCRSVEIQSQSLTIVTSASNGFLCDELGEMKTIWYGIGSSQLLNMLSFLFAQIQLFFMVIALILRSYYRGESVIVINNTILCLGSIIASRCLRALTISYLHELPSGHSLEQKLTRKMAVRLIKKAAHEIVFVSHFLSRNYSFNKNRQTVIPNGLRADFNGHMNVDYAAKFRNRKILFVGSLRFYKGVDELLKIARGLPEVPFMAVFNCSDKELTHFRGRLDIPINLSLYARDPKLEEKYREAFLVVNLSLPSLCVEGFGLTILEGMSHGCPCIVPPVGGHLDYFEDSAGIKLDARNTDEIIYFITNLLTDELCWRNYASQALFISQKYSALAYQQHVDRFLCDAKDNYLN
jgi:L-malate glycosyltransferase